MLQHDPANTGGTLLIHLSDRVVFDAGTMQERSNADGIHRDILPPNELLFDQVLEYLERQLPGDAFGMSSDDEAHAAMAICVRWGSYFAVLSNSDFPLWPEVRRCSANIS